MTNSQKPIVFVMAALPKPLQARLESHYHTIVAYKDFEAAIRASGLAGEVRAAVTMSGLGMDAAMLALLPKLGLVSTYGAGYDRVDTAALKARGIKLSNAGGANAACVADMAMTLLLSSSLRLLAADRLVREGGWTRTPPKGWTLSPGFGGKKLGVYGMGAIGLGVAKRSEPFELEVAYHNRRKRADAPYRYFEKLVDLAAWCDYLVVACPHTDETHHSVNREVLKALGPQGYLVNVGRGPIIDQEALIAALADGTIAGAGLDVIEGEPVVPEALKQAQNVVMTPHIGAVTQRALVTLDDRLLDNLDAFFAGKPLVSEVVL